MGQQEALAPIDPRQVRVPVLRVTRRYRVGDGEPMATRAFSSRRITGRSCGVKLGRRSDSTGGRSGSAWRPDRTPNGSWRQRPFHVGARQRSHRALSARCRARRRWNPGKATKEPASSWRPSAGAAGTIFTCTFPSATCPNVMPDSRSTPDHRRHPQIRAAPTARRVRRRQLDRDAEEPRRLRVAFPVGPGPHAVGRGLHDSGVPVADDVHQIAERAGPDASSSRYAAAGTAKAARARRAPPGCPGRSWVKNPPIPGPVPPRPPGGPARAARPGR